MAVIQVYREAPCCATVIPNIFIDQYMADANGEFVKIYLYLLRCMSQPEQTCSICTIADHFNHTEKDVLRGLKYWEKVHLIRLEYAADKKIAAIHLLAFPENEPVAPEAAAELSLSAVVSPVPEKPAKREYTHDEIKNFYSDAEISELFFIIETYLKRPVSSTETNTILYWHEELHFSAELIAYLVEYCLSKGHASFHYMDKVALGWHDQQITTVEQAKATAAAHSKPYYAVVKAFGITGRSLVQSETDFLTKWSKDYCFDLDLILEACSRTMSAIHQPSFEYADRILSNWYDHQVHTKADIQKLDELHTAGAKTAKNETKPKSKNGFHNFNERNYDYEKLEKELLASSKKN